VKAAMGDDRLQEFVNPVRSSNFIHKKALSRQPSAVRKIPTHNRPPAPARSDRKLIADS